MAQHGTGYADAQSDIDLNDLTGYTWQAPSVASAGGGQFGIAQWVSGVGSSRFTARELPRQVPDYTDEDIDLDLDAEIDYSQRYSPPSGYEALEDYAASSTASTARSTCSGTVSNATTQITEPPLRRNGNMAPFAGQEPVPVNAQDLAALGGNLAVPAPFAGQGPLHELASGPPSNSDAMSARWEQESVEAQLEDLAIDISEHQSARSGIVPVEEAFAMRGAADDRDSASASLSVPMEMHAGEQQYTLPCEFARISNCREHFHPDDEAGWIDHIERVHLHNHFPHVSICWFCATLFDTSTTRPDDGDRKKNFELRLYHIADHFRHDGMNLGHWMPDFDLLRYLRRHRLIADDRYRQLMDFQQGPHRQRYARPDYVPPEQARQRERQSLRPHDQNKEDRDRRRHHKDGKSTGKSSRDKHRRNK